MNGAFDGVTPPSGRYSIGARRKDGGEGEVGKKGIESASFSNSERPNYQEGYYIFTTQRAALQLIQEKRDRSSTYRYSQIIHAKFGERLQSSRN